MVLADDKRLAFDEAVVNVIARGANAKSAANARTQCAATGPVFSCSTPSPLVSVWRPKRRSGLFRLKRSWVTDLRSPEASNRAVMLASHIDFFGDATVKFPVRVAMGQRSRAARLSQIKEP